MLKITDTFQQSLLEVYGEKENSCERFMALTKKYKEYFHMEEPEYFTSPGRMELIGNHTDHNGGKVLAASIQMDTIAAAGPNRTETVTILSEGYEQPFMLNLEELETIPGDEGTLSLLAGIFQGCRACGFHVHGFQACISTNVLSAAGVSSSASFEMLICAIINYYFNENKMSCIDYARIGSYAENHYWNKQSGLMDQLACAAGGMIFLDFSDSELPCVERMESESILEGYDIILVNTGKGHGDLSREYSEIPSEMKKVAAQMGKTVLSEASLPLLLKKLPMIRENCGDRSFLRSLHFYEENNRVDKAKAALINRDTKELLELINESGNSSWKYLQNCHIPSDTTEESVCVALALSELFIQNAGRGACRVHGGGFAGVILSIIPSEASQDYIRFMSEYMGGKNIFRMSLRDTGAIHLKQ